MHKLAYFILLAAVLSLSACSDGNSDAPPDNQAHPADWFSTHPGSAEDSPGYQDCQSCHGSNLQGSGDAVSCYGCHSYNQSPPFSTHPPSWLNAYSDHRGYATANGTNSCTPCHGKNLHGYQSAPSCFSANYDGLTCHADGPGQAPHPLDGSYLLGTNHGPDAKADLTFCQSCHGQPGGPGTNPRFNLGIEAAGGDGCESCHGTDYAHPQNWAGPNNTFHYTAGNIQNACTLCHGVNLDGTGTPEPVGVSCIGCHDSTTAFTLDCTYCHGYPPDGMPDDVTDTGVDHLDVPLASHLECLICHGVNQTEAGGYFEPAANYQLFDYDTDTNGDHWDGNMQMSATANYNPDNFGCNTIVCHANDAEHQLSDSGLPVILKDFFAGE